ncbi:MAG: hypothetical protein WKG07_27910 [Hymenobacter sp.]
MAPIAWPTMLPHRGRWYWVGLHRFTAVIRGDVNRIRIADATNAGWGRCTAPSKAMLTIGSRHWATGAGARLHRARRRAHRYGCHRADHAAGGFALMLAVPR